MAFVTTSLQNNGVTQHFSIRYDDSLPSWRGLDIARQLLNHCESDFALMQSWFTGVNFKFAVPINVQITGNSGGARWQGPPDIGNWLGFHPSIDIMPGSNPTTGLVRYLMVSEVTEMFMASQGKQWYATFVGFDEGSMGESLSRFLASQFLSITGISKAIYPPFGVVECWLNDPLRPNFVDVAPDDTLPDATTGCGTCFIFFLKDQLGFSIQQIIAAADWTLAGVHKNLTGKTDGFQTFKDLVDLHYPSSGNRYFPPLDNIFPVPNLVMFYAPAFISWVSNGTPNIANIGLDQFAAAGVDIMLTSDDPTTINIPASVMLGSYYGVVSLDVKTQGAAFSPKVVNLTASYAGKVITVAVNVVQPEELPVAPLNIQSVTNNDPCAQHYIAGMQQDFIVKNTNVLLDRHGLTYRWTVVGAVAQNATTPTLTISSLPSPGSEVTVNVSLRNAAGIQAKGELKFTTVVLHTGLREELRRLNCSLRELKAIAMQIPPNVPVEEVTILQAPEHLTRIEDQSRHMATAAERVTASLKATRASLKAKSG